MIPSTPARHLNPTLHHPSLLSSAPPSNIEQCAVGLPQWSTGESFELAAALAAIVSRIFAIACIAELDMGMCVTDKMAKNNRKYPADRAKGSSAKYTMYASAAVPLPVAGVAVVLAAVGGFTLARYYK